MNIISQIIIVSLLILLNSFFAASEYVVISFRKSRLNELLKKGDLLASLINKAQAEKDRFVTATQIGTAIVSLLLGLLGEPLVAKIIESIFFFIPKGNFLILIHSLSIIVSILILAFVLLVFGELIPKTIALNKTELIGFIIIAPLVVFVKIVNPLIELLKTINEHVLEYFGFENSSDAPQVYSKDEVKIILNEIQQNGGVKKDELEIMQNVFKLADTSIKQLMTPKNEVVGIEANTLVKNFLSKDGENHSRFPVYKKTFDQIIGYIHIKDVYKQTSTIDDKKRFSDLNLVRNVMNIPETKKADEVLIDMRKKHTHLAIVYDEFGIMVGVVTLEDIIESLIGDIQDEFDRPIKGIKRNRDGSYLINGNINPDIIRKKFRLPIKGQTYATIGGLIFGILGREPRIGDELAIGHLFFEIKKTKGKRIDLLILKRESKKLTE
ncbi:hemolysin family protein [Patescibacteria group bacterium]|nr:hemolysin family protein [Patescibacteria group bacterium]